MKIAYILAPNIIISGDSNGIKAQASSWKSGLEKLGHTVDAINTWGNYAWETYDLIHIFGTGLWLPGLVKRLNKYNKNIVISPIIDSIKKPYIYKLSSFVGIEKLRLYSPTYALRHSLPYVQGVFVRSNYEAKFFTYSLGCIKDKIFKVPIQVDPPLVSNTVPKEDFCFHVSSIYQKRKNVLRLIQAAQKYNFKLVLAGSKGSKLDYEPIKKQIGSSSNIEVLGFVSREELIEMYQRAKVFALPSIREGVGIVALDAAVYGCEIVITNVGGPKEYYNGKAHIINPYNVDEIGQAIRRGLSENNYQPELKKMIESNYSISTISKQIEFVYRHFANNK